MQKKFLPVQRLRILGGSDAWSDRNGQAFACTADVDRSHTDEQRQRRYRFEIDQTFQSNAANTAQIPVPSDPRHQRAEYQRRHNHFD